APEAVERLARDQLHGDEAALFPDLVDRADVRVIERGCVAGLAQQARAGRGVAHDICGEDVERHLALQVLVERAVHLAHAARTETVDHGEVSEAGTRGQRWLRHAFALPTYMRARVSGLLREARGRRSRRPHDSVHPRRTRWRANASPA